MLARGVGRHGCCFLPYCSGEILACAAPQLSVPLNACRVARLSYLLLLLASMYWWVSGSPGPPAA